MKLQVQGRRTWAVEQLSCLMSFHTSCQVYLLHVCLARPHVPPVAHCVLSVYLNTYLPCLSFPLSVGQVSHVPLLQFLRAFNCCSVSWQCLAFGFKVFPWDTFGFGCSLGWFPGFDCQWATPCLASVLFWFSQTFPQVCQDTTVLCPWVSPCKSVVVIVVAFCRRSPGTNRLKCAAHLQPSPKWFSINCEHMYNHCNIQKKFFYICCNELYCNYYTLFYYFTR